MKPTIANALALGIGSLLALGLGEVGLRLFAPQTTGPVWFTFDPDLGEVPAPGGKGERAQPGAYRFSFTHDQNGLRVVPSAAGVEASRTLLVLGDSYVYGLGVDDDETFSNHLQEAVRPFARVVNAGNPAKGTDYALRFFLARGAPMRPDVVLLAFFKNDFGDNARETYFSLTSTGRLEPRPLRDTRSRRRTLLEPLPAVGWLLSTSHLVNLLRRAAIVFTYDRARTDGPSRVLARDDGPRGFDWVNPHRRELTRRYLAELRDAVQEQGGALLVFYVPDARDVWEARRGSAPSVDERAFRELAAELGLRSLSLTPVLAASPEPLERLYVEDGHWSAVAHTLAARALTKVTLDLLERGSGEQAPR